MGEIGNWDLIWMIFGLVGCFYVINGELWCGWGMLSYLGRGCEWFEEVLERLSLGLVM